MYGAEPELKRECYLPTDFDQPFYSFLILKPFEMDSEVPWKGFDQCGFLGLLKRLACVTEKFVLASKVFDAAKVSNAVRQADIWLW